MVLDFLAAAEHPRLAALGTSCPDHFLRTKVKPLVLDLPPDAPLEAAKARLAELHEAYRADYQAYYDRYADADSPAIRGADPLVVLVPGVGMFSYGKDKQTARVAGEFYVNAINVMRGAEGISTYAPIDEREKFRIEYWALEEAKLARLPKPKPLATRIARRHRRRVRDRQGDRAPPRGRGGLRGDRRPRRREGGGRRGRDRRPRRRRRGRGGRHRRGRGAGDGRRDCVLAFGGLDLVVNNAGLSLSKSLLETTVADWDLQHDVMAKGSFLVSRAAARVLIDQGLGGDIVYISSARTRSSPGPTTSPTPRPRPTRPTRCGCWPPSSASTGSRSTASTPTGSSAGPGIFAGGWGAKRAAVYGVPESELGAYYAQRTLLKREVLPENVANAVFVLCSADLSHTTGLHVPVDAGVAAAFLR